MYRQTWQRYGHLLNEAQTDKYPPKSQMYGAVNYFLNVWDGIEAIPTGGDYAWDNNKIERINRYISLSRKNFFDYLADVLNRCAEMPNGTPSEDFRNLLPDRWARHID